MNDFQRDHLTILHYQGNTFSHFISLGLLFNVSNVSIVNLTPSMRYCTGYKDHSYSEIKFSKPLGHDLQIMVGEIIF